MASQLRAKTISGAKWQTLATYSAQVIQAATAVALAWLVGREDYGIIAAAMVVVKLVQACGSLGMDYALTHWRGDVQRAVDTSFILMVAVAIVSYVAALCAAPVAAAYFGEPRLPWIIAVVGCLLLLKPMAQVARGTLGREFRFRRLFVLDTSSVVVSSALALGLAALLPKDRRYWALAAAGVGREIMRAAASWFLTVVRPRLRFDWAVAKELLHYGKYFVLSALVMVLYANAERIALGGLLPTAMLGLYVFAYRWVFRLGSVSEAIFGSVSTPVYAKLQDDVPRLRESYCRIVRLSALLSTGLLTGMALLVPDAVALVFPPRWAASVPIFQVLGLWYLVRAVDTTTGQLYAAIGKPKYNTALAVVNLAVMGITVVPFILWWGPVGAAWALFAARVVCLVCNTLICRRVLRCSLRRLVGIVVPALKAGSVMAAVLCIAEVALLRWVVAYRPGWIDSAFEWVALGGLVAFGAAVYAAALYAFERELFREVVGLLRDALPARWRSGDAPDA